MGPAAADVLTTAVSSTAAMRIGDDVIHNGRLLILLGHDPMSVTDRRADVEDPETGERFSVPLDELEPAAPVDDAS